MYRDKKGWLVLAWLLFLAPMAQAQLVGTVVDGVTHEPIEGARVRIHKQIPLAETDASGNFSLSDSAPFPYMLTASAYGYYNAWTSITASSTGPFTFELQPISLESNPNVPLNPPSECFGCHEDMVNQWQGSPMQKTGLNTWVFDLYNGTGTPGGMNGFVYQRDSIHKDTFPNSDCSACHSPVHWLADIENNGMGDIENPNEDMELGVQCEVCHRAYDVDINQTYMPGVQPESFHLLRNSNNLEFGPLGDTTFNGGIMLGAYNPQLRAQVCSACHEDNVDHDGDGEFNDPGSLPHETTFTEWRNWQALDPDNHTEACADCHMAALNTDSFCIFVEGRPLGTARSHDIRGTTPEFLENALTMDVQVTENLGTLDVDVTLLNDLTGHAVPSGVVVRNMILLVIARDQDGERLTMISGDQVDEVGGIGNFDEGDYAGHPGFAFYRNMSDGVNERIFYTEAQSIPSDTRIQPGEAYQGSWSFGLVGVQDSDVEIKVLYRRAFREFVLIKNWTLTGHGEPLDDIAAPHFGFLMEHHQEALDICGQKDLSGNGSVTLEDLNVLAPQWLAPAPFGTGVGPNTDIRHFVSLTNCLP